MSHRDVHSLGETAVQLLVEQAWAQWSALSVAAHGSRHTLRSTIDAEVLAIQSVVVGADERRLVDLLRGWLVEGGALISVQRTRTLVRELPPRFQEVQGALAALATATGDHRWKRYVTPHGSEIVASSREKKSGPLRLDAAGALMLRLRAGMGAGTKADILAVLLGQTEPLPLRAICDLLRYLPQPLRVALDDMVAAGFVERIDATPALFRANAEQWQTALSGGFHDVPRRSDFPPRWLPSADFMIFLAHVMDWSATATSSDWSEYVASSRARDVVERYLTPAMLRELKYRAGTLNTNWDLNAFRELLSRIAEYSRKNV